MGDILISYGDFLYNSKPLAPSGYVEEWWVEDLRKAMAQRSAEDLEKSLRLAKITPERLKALSQDPFAHKPSLREALDLSRSLNVPLHPSFTFFWSDLTPEEIKQLRRWLQSSSLQHQEDLVLRVEGQNEVDVKRMLEVLCLPHRVSGDKITLDGDEAHVFALCLGSDKADDENISSARSSLEALDMLSGVQVRAKAPTFVGARMGRPEKAKRREMKPLVHVLFPTGSVGGPKRDIVEAAGHGPEFVELVKRKCPNCKTFTIRVKCPECGSETLTEKTCPNCGRSLKTEQCPSCKTRASQSQKQAINFRQWLDAACKRLGTSTPKALKGVKGLSNETKTPEIMEKGLLRAKHDLSVYKDGTIRFDATNAPLTHFKPTEIGVSIERLKQLGYTHAVDGSPLTDRNQICELRMQDVVIPDEGAKYFLRVAGFVDELLEKVYQLPPYYNVRRKEELVGHLVVGLAPHTCAGVLGRIIGFTSLNLCYAHPVWHSAKRRDCDGDEDALMLALDTLLDFSREYLPAQIGGIMDAPLLLIPTINTAEVQRQAHDFDVTDAYPLEFYEKTMEKTEARQLGSIMDLIRSRLGTESQFENFRFTTPVSNVSMGNAESAYKQFKAMVEKLDGQLELAKRIEAVDAEKVALKVLTTHFMRDIAGNLRAFSTQAFRCKSCGKRFRRMPLRGKCLRCGGQLTLTVYRGGIEKYVNAAQQLVERYGLPRYYAQRIALMREEIAATFENKKSKQISLSDFS